ncbi:unnamed protein product [Prorocentrum cordatum]|uniref:Uncharacterized protein n=1 Tax=Prorocentrum cordatum TaxID=2364126 RepID=A0ABN9VGA2_9DINO|nr:unnamed protein product [Polarella glacialis]
MPKGRDDVPPAFVPSGWLNVQREAIQKERKHFAESSRQWQLARDGTAGPFRALHPRFTQEVRFTRAAARMVQERYAGSRAGAPPPAGVGSADDYGAVLRCRFTGAGREAYLSRSDAGLIAQLTASGSHGGTLPARLTASASAPQLAAGLRSSRSFAAAGPLGPGSPLATAGMATLPKVGLQVAAVTIGSEETYRDGMLP